MKPNMFRPLLIFFLALAACTVNTQKRAGDIVLPFYAVVGVYFYQTLAAIRHGHQQPD
jgi:uncharacterized membrane protein